VAEDTDVNQPATADRWTSYLTPFANALGIDVAKATELLKSVAGDAGDRAMAILKDSKLSPDADIKTVLPSGTPSGVANQAITLLRATATTTEQPMVFNPTADLLPAVPSDTSWLEALKAGGTLKVDQATVISAIKAALADRVGLFDLPQKVSVAMEAFADSSQEQVDPRFFILRKQLTRRSYGEIFAAIDGLDGNFVTDRRKKELMDRIGRHMWPAVLSFHGQLKAWIEAWQQGAANPAMLIPAIMQMVGGGSLGAMPPGMMQPPDSGTLRDAADGVNDDMNRIFAGTGVVTTRALAFEASQIKATMEDPSLPALIGAANREQMLRQLGVDVSSNYARLEVNLAKYVMGILNIKAVPGGNEETAYFGALYMLGSQIPWDQLGRMSSISGGRGRSRTSSDSEELAEHGLSRRS